MLRSKFIRCEKRTVIQPTSVDIRMGEYILPPKNDKDDFNTRFNWEQECKEKLKKKDKNSSFYSFGASYHIETIEVTE